MSQTLLQEAITAFKNQDFSAVETVLAPVLAGKEPPFAEAFLLAGMAANIQGQYPTALTYLDKANALAPQNGSILKEKGMAHYNLGDTKSAVMALEEGVSAAPTHEEIRGLLALSLLAESLPQKALPHVAWGRENCPSHPLFTEAYLRQLIADKNYGQAQKELCGMAGKSMAEKAVARTNETFLSVPETVSPVLATSLAPGRIPAQQEAVQSWLDLDLTVISVNIADEIDQLKPLFPEVTFVEVARNGMEKIGRPLIYLSDILTALAETEAPVCGLINADVILTEKPAFASGALFLTSRVNVPGEELSGDRYRSGYDFFVFERDFIDHIPATDLMLGAPWWDYFLPSLALAKGTPLCESEKDILFHRRHKTAWSQTLFAQTAFLWAEAFLAIEKKATTEAAALLKLIAEIIPLLEKRRHQDLSLIAMLVSQIVLTETNRR